MNATMSSADTELAGIPQGAGGAGSTGRSTLRRFARDKAAAAGAVVLVVYCVVALAAPWLAPYDPVELDLDNRFATPSAEHPLGTDNLGRDELSRLVHSARLSLGLALTATAGITILGLVLGVLAGTLGSAVDSMIMRMVDVLQALPALILALVVVGLLGPGIPNLLLTIIGVGWPGYARVVRAMTFGIRENDFVEAARSLGASRLRIVVRHITPNLIGPMIVLSTLGIGRTLLAVSGLSFLGFGANVAVPDWGGMLAEARSYIDSAPRLLAFPGAAITLLVIACNLVGDGVRDLLDVRLGDRAS